MGEGAGSRVRGFQRPAGEHARDTPWPIIVVTTRGNKTGKIRKFALIRVEQDGQYALVASKGGAEENPVWYRNLVADPEAVMIQDGPEPFDVVLREVSGEEKALWWGAGRGRLSPLRPVPGKDRPRDPGPGRHPQAVLRGLGSAARGQMAAVRAVVRLGLGDSAEDADGRCQRCRGQKTVAETGEPTQTWANEGVVTAASVKVVVGLTSTVTMPRRQLPTTLNEPDVLAVPHVFAAAVPLTEVTMPCTWPVLGAFTETAVAVRTPKEKVPSVLTWLATQTSAKDGVGSAESAKVVLVVTSTVTM